MFAKAKMRYLYFMPRDVGLDTRRPSDQGCHQFAKGIVDLTIRRMGTRPSFDSSERQQYPIKCQVDGQHNILRNNSQSEVDLWRHQTQDFER